MKAAPLRHPALRALSLILLGCYSFVFFQSQVLHPIAHFAHDHELHSEQAEADLCHQSIYHEAAISCGHSQHVDSEHLDCELCDFLLTPQEIDETETKVDPEIQASRLLISGYIALDLQANSGQQSTRGPPAIL